MGSESPSITLLSSLESQTRDEQSELPPDIHGIGLTSSTQCAHWHSPLDIIAIKHACCQKFYACISCHNTLESSHVPAVWKRKDWDEGAVFCGNCKRIWSVKEYLAGKESKCGGCGVAWNPGCKNHWNLYFDVDEKVKIGSYSD
jgi:uncharacterized CHY-type Zn-finger protein